MPLPPPPAQKAILLHVEKTSDSVKKIAQTKKNSRFLPAQQKRTEQRDSSIPATQRSVFGITARHDEQNSALDLLLNLDLDIVTLFGVSGTGKTLLALAAGLEQALTLQRYWGVVFTSSALFEAETSDTLNDLDEHLEYLLKNKKDEQQSLLQESTILQHIKVRSIRLICHQTFYNKFLIIDQAQNLSAEQIKAVLTKAGVGSKIVFLANPVQQASSSSASAILDVAQRFRSWPHAGHLVLNRGGHSRLAEYARRVL